MDAKFYVFLATAVAFAAYFAAGQRTNVTTSNIIRIERGNRSANDGGWPRRGPATANGTANAAVLPPRKWLTELFLEAENVFDMDDGVNAACRRDFAAYKRFLENQTVWAVRMLESTQWPAIGVLSGLTHTLGVWDECLHAKPVAFKSQYCLVAANYNFTYDATLNEDAFEWGQWPNEQKSAWEILQFWAKDENRLSRQTISWAMCIPSSCQPRDVETALNHTLYPIFKKHDLTARVHVLPEFCKVDRTTPYPLSFYITCIGIASGIAVIVLCTMYEYSVRNDEPAKGFKELLITFICFLSLRKNLSGLTKFSPENTYPIIHLFKILTAFFVLSGHRFMLFYFYPTFNTEVHEMYRQTFSFELLETSVVDIFITISGFLMFHYSYESVRKGGPVFVVFYIIFRWLRMMSVPILLIIMILFVAEHLNTGPLWNHYFTMHVGFCQRNWWTTVFAINNIVEPDKPCLPQTWYLSVDLQLTILGSIILLIMAKNMKIGVFFCLVMIGVSMVASYVIIFVQKYCAILKFTVSNARDFLNVRDYHMLYVTSYNRVGPYLLGMLAALLSKNLREQKYRFSGTGASLLIGSTFLFGIAFQSYGFVFYKSHRPYDPVENATYGALSRLFFALPFACLFCIHFTSGLGIFNNIFNNKFFVPYGRLVYCVYLLGPTLQTYQVISQRTYYPIQEKLIGYWIATGDFVWVYMVALVVYLTTEAPVNNVLKYVQSKILGSKS